MSSTEEDGKKRSRLWGRLFIATSFLLAVSVLRFVTRHRPPPEVHEEPARASTLEALGDLAEGVPLGAYVVTGVTEPVGGAVLVHASGKGSEVTYEVRRASDTPLPAAQAGRYSVYYRELDGGPDVLAGAIALGKFIARAPKTLPAIQGLTEYPAAPGP